MGTDTEQAHCEVYTAGKKLRPIGCWETNVVLERLRLYLAGDEDVTIPDVGGVNYACGKIYAEFGGNMTLARERIINDYLVQNPVRMIPEADAIITELRELLEDAVLENPHSRFTVQVGNDVPEMLAAGESITFPQPAQGDTTEILISNFISAESTGNAFEIDSGDHIEHQNYVWFLRKRFSAESGQPDTVENHFVAYNRVASV